VHFIHAQRLAFQLKGELVESQRQCFLKEPEPFVALTRDTDVDVLGGASTLRACDFFVI